MSGFEITVLKSLLKSLSENNWEVLHVCDFFQQCQKTLKKISNKSIKSTTSSNEILLTSLFTLPFSKASYKMFYYFFSAAFPFLSSSLAPPSQQNHMSHLDQLLSLLFCFLEQVPLTSNSLLCFWDFIFPFPLTCSSSHSGRRKWDLTVNILSHILIQKP